MSAANPSVIAHKFGGTSMADASRIAHAAQLLLAETGFTTQVTVVSALKGTTDGLIRCAQLAAAQDDGWQALLDQMLKRHYEAADNLLSCNRTQAEQFLNAESERLREVLHALSLLKSLPETAFEWVQGLGEVWSAYLLHAHLVSLGPRGGAMYAAPGWISAKAICCCPPVRGSGRRNWRWQSPPGTSIWRCGAGCG